MDWRDSSIHTKPSYFSHFQKRTMPSCLNQQLSNLVNLIFVCLLRKWASFLNSIDFKYLCPVLCSFRTWQIEYSCQRKMSVPSPLLIQNMAILISIKLLRFYISVSSQFQFRLRGYIKHLKECFIRFPNTSNFVKNNTPLLVLSSTL